MKRAYREGTKTIPAGSDESIAINGATHFKCQTATGKFLLSADDSSPSNFKAGRKITSEKGKVFNTIRVQNPTSQDVTITYTFGTGDIEDDAIVIDGSTVTGSGQNLVTLDPVTVGQAPVKISGDVENVTRIWIVSEDSKIRIGDENITTSKGHPSEKLQTAIMETSADIYAISTDGNTTIQVMCEVE